MAKAKSMEELIRDILKNNPQVDPKKLLEGRAATENLRKIGRRRRGYNLSIPTSRKKVRILDDDLDDPRTVHLRTRP